MNDTEIGTLLVDPAARAVIDRHLPDSGSQDQIDMPRSPTLRGIQRHAVGKVTDRILADIQADLETLPLRK